MTSSLHLWFCNVIITDVHTAHTQRTWHEVQLKELKVNQSRLKRLLPSRPLHSCFGPSYFLYTQYLIIDWCFVSRYGHISIFHFIPVCLCLRSYFSVVNVSVCHHHENHLRPSSDLLVPPVPDFPFLVFQSTCDTLRSHSDSLGFAPNVLPSHPAIGNFEEFACWWRTQAARPRLAFDGKLWNIW